MADVQPLDPADPEAVRASYLGRPPRHGLMPTIRRLMVWYMQQLPPEGPEPQTIRHLWYTVLKGALGRAGMLDPAWYGRHGLQADWQLTEGGIALEWSRKLSRVLGDLVAEGATSYADLAIIDGSRQRRKARASALGLLDVPTIGVRYPQVVLATEKDTLYPVLAQVARLLGVTAVSGGGQPSAAVTEELARHIGQHTAAEPKHAASGRVVYLLTVTDYDAHGADIAHALYQQLHDAAGRVPDLTRWQVDHQHLGVTPDQVPDLADAVYPVPGDKVLPRWVADGHGLDANGRPYPGWGQVYGIELDQLGVSGMRALMVRGVMTVLDGLGLHDLHDDLAWAAVRQAVWVRIAPTVRGIMTAYNQAVGWDAFDALTEALDTQQADAAEPWQGPVGRLALAGRSYIDPLDDAADLWGPSGPADLQRLVAEAEPGITPVVLPPAGTP